MSEQPVVTPPVVRVCVECGREAKVLGPDERTPYCAPCGTPVWDAFLATNPWPPEKFR